MAKQKKKQCSLVLPKIIQIIVTIIYSINNKNCSKSIEKTLQKFRNYSSTPKQQINKKQFHSTIKFLPRLNLKIKYELIIIIIQIKRITI